MRIAGVIIRVAVVSELQQSPADSDKAKHRPFQPLTQQEKQQWWGNAVPLFPGTLPEIPPLPQMPEVPPMPHTFPEQSWNMRTNSK
jgi:hypothetical protein